MQILNQLQTSKIDLENICVLNQFVDYTSETIGSRGKSYKIDKFLLSKEDTVNFPWKYEVNKYGYRGKDWNFNKNTFGFFGCSFTFGIGVKRSISNIVEKNLSMECINLGIPGGSFKNIIKSFAAFTNHHPLEYALITLPEYHRIYYPRIEKNVCIHSNLLFNYISKDRTTEKIKKNMLKYYNEDLMMSDIADLVDWAETISKIRDIKLFWSFWDPSTYSKCINLVDTNRTVEFPDILDKARDNGHPGPETVNQWSKNVLKRLNNV
jgi:hypothetical protein